MDFVYIVWFMMWKIVLLAIFPTISILLLMVLLSYFISAYDDSTSLADSIVRRIFFGICMVFLVGASAEFYTSKPGLDWKEKLLESYKEYSTQAEIDIQKNRSKEAVRVYHTQEIHRFILVSYAPPKHVYVSIKHADSGKTYENLYVSKHCSARPVLNNEYNVVVRPYHMSDKPEDVKWEFPNLYQEFCS